VHNHPTVGPSRRGAFDGTLPPEGTDVSVNRAAVAILPHWRIAPAFGRTQDERWELHWREIASLPASAGQYMPLIDFRSSPLP
jgi:hypothetical protein